MTNLDIRILGPRDAHHLSPLIAENAQALKRGAPRRPDDYYAEQILHDRTAQVIGALREGELIGFAVFFDLPDLISGRRIGQVEEIYVRPEFRHQGIGRSMIEALIVEGQSHDWLRIRWLVPTKEAPSVGLYEKIAAPEDKKAYTVAIVPVPA